MREAGRGQTYFRIIGTVTLRRDLAARNLLERVAQEGRVAIIEFLQGGNRRTGIGENLRVNRRRCFDLIVATELRDRNDTRKPRC